MAIFAVGASTKKKDVSQDFIKNNIAGPLWSNSKAPALHQFISSLKAGDIIYIKAAAFGAPITVKAIGIVLDNVIVTDSTIVSIGRNVKWVVTDKFTIEKQIEKNNVRSNTMYEEFHPDVQKIIIDKLFS